MSPVEYIVKRCTKCERELPVESFYRDSRYKDGCQGWCKNCRADYQAAHHAAHREERNARNAANRVAHRVEIAAYHAAYRATHHMERAAYDAAYRAANPESHRVIERNRRARKRDAEGTHTAADVRAQLKRQTRRCFYCGEKVGEDFHVDHVVPLGKGGSNGPENLVIACASCNLSKGAKHPIDFAGRLL